MSDLRSFVDLLGYPTELEDWIAAFCGLAPAEPPSGPEFPDLFEASTPADWLVEQFYELSSVPGARDQLRQAIVNLIATQGGRDVSPEMSDQIVGTLLEVAGTLRFVEVSRYLADWVRKPSLKKRHVYKVNRRELSLRSIVWDLLLGWGAVDGIVPQLTVELADLAASDEPGTAQLAFVALGQRAPAQALRLVPQMAKLWHLEYWESTVQRFLQSVHPRVLLSAENGAAWTECLGLCLYKQETNERLRDQRPFAEADPKRSNHLYAVVKRAGLSIKNAGGGHYEINNNGTRLHVNLSSYRQPRIDAARFPVEGYPVGRFEESWSQPTN